MKREYRHEFNMINIQGNKDRFREFQKLEIRANTYRHATISRAMENLQNAGFEKKAGTLREAMAIQSHFVSDATAEVIKAREILQTSMHIPFVYRAQNRPLPFSENGENCTIPDALERDLALIRNPADLPSSEQWALMVLKKSPSIDALKDQDYVQQTTTLAEAVDLANSAPDLVQLAKDRATTRLFDPLRYN